ncbi:hypothetical protein FO519_003375 [Halicephalobus sp. NKZ332]|nr:hypothetical protein FO519_003375 [Halicephalobus sp. NKZ332]
MSEKKKHSGFEKIRKGSASMSAQISRTARRLSTVIAPQLTKLDPLPCLQTITRVSIKVTDIKKIHHAMENYILHNMTNFDPIGLEINGDGKSKMILRAELSAEELVLLEGQKRVTSIIFADIEDEDFTVAKIRHPISGIKMYEIVDLAHNGNWQIFSSTDDTGRCQIDSMTNCFRQLISMCGLSYVPNWWVVRSQANYLGQIEAQHSIFKENMMIVDWNLETENEIRILMLCFGLVQMIRERFPQMMTIIKEYRVKKAAT